MITPDWLKILCCPETHQSLTLADAALVERLNQAIDAGELHNRNHQKVQERIEGGLVRADGRYLYPIRQDIPILLVEEGLPLME